MVRQETFPFILFIGEHPLIYYTLFINELKGGTLGNVPINFEDIREFDFVNEILLEKGFDVFIGKFLVKMFRHEVNLLDKVWLTS